MRITLVFNPTAGTAVDIKDLIALLNDAGHEVRYVSTKDDWQRIVAEPSDAVVAAGGDGTVRKVALAVAGTPRPFAILPFGTANNVGKTLGLIGDLHSIIAAWEQPARPFDVAQVQANGATERFVESFGAGLFADLIERGRTMDDSAAMVGRQTDRALWLLSELLTDARPHEWGLIVDGEEIRGSFLAAEVLNIRFAGPNVPLAPYADPGDGQLDVALIREEDRAAVRAYVDTRLRLASGVMPEVRVIRGREINLRVPSGAAMHVDDQPWLDAQSAMDVAIRVRSAAARILAELPGAS